MNAQPPLSELFGDGRTLADLIADFAQSAQGTNNNLTAQGLTRLKDWIGTNKLRYFVYNAAAFGNLANTVNLMKRLVQLGLTNNIELIYDATPTLEEPTLNKLAVLLPGFDPDHPEVPYTLVPGTVITFFPYTAEGRGTVKGLEGDLLLCINGGSEKEDITEPNLAEVFKVSWYLQLQPYMWEVVNTKDHPKSLILARDAEAPESLQNQKSLQNGQFVYRAFAMAKPPAPDWTALLNIPAGLTNLDSIGVAKVISDQVAAKKIVTAPVYGLYDEVNTNPVPQPANQIAFQYIAAAAVAQNTAGLSKLPAVITVLSNLQDTTWQRIASFFPLAGVRPVRPDPPSESSGSEEENEWGLDFSEEEFDETLFNVQNWCYLNGLVRPNPALPGLRSRLRIVQKMDPADLSKLTAALKPEEVLVVGAPRVPPDVFNHLYAIAGFPSMFEGQGTANLALNLGLPFFKLTRSEGGSYPSTYGNGQGKDAATVSAKADELQQLTYTNLQMGYGAFAPDGARDGKLVQTLAQCMSQMTAGSNGFGEYFEGLEAFYGNSANDKLLQALVFLVATLLPNGQGNLHALRALAASALTEGDAPLDKLYAQIETAISKGVLKLIPTVIPDGPVADFLTAVIKGKDFDIGSDTSPVQVLFPASRDRITVIGRTSDFLGIPLETSVIFQMNENGTDIDTGFALKLGEISLAGVQWFKLDALNVTAAIPGNDNRMHGTIAARILLGGNPVSFDLAFPSSADGKVVIEGDFTTNPPSLNDLFKLLGGMNFMTTLPPQISAVGNIELHKLKFGYDFKASQIDSFQLTLENSQPWPLFGKLELSSLAFDIALIEPTGRRRITWTASTTVAIGASGGSIDATVSYPDLTVTAGLNQDGPPIPVGDLVTFFLPDDYSINLAADVTAFDMVVKPGEKGAATIYKVSGGLTMRDGAWTLSLGGIAFTLTDIHVIVEGRESDIKGKTAVTGSLTAGTVLDFNTGSPDDLSVPFSIYAAYRGKGVWFFSGTQDEKPIRIRQIVESYLDPAWWIEGLPDLDVADLQFNLQTPETGADPKAATSYMVGGKIRVWNTPLGSSFETTIEGRFGRGKVDPPSDGFAMLASRAEVPVLNHKGQLVPATGTALIPALAVAEDGAYGVVSADILWNNVELKIYYNYAPAKRIYGFTWGIFNAEIDSQTNTATMTFTRGTTLGAMVETFISWLTGSKFGLSAPWNLLNKIDLSNFKLIWNFDKDTVEFDVEIGPIDLIFARIDSIALTYQSSGPDKGVNVTLKGSFPWIAFLSDDEAAGNTTDKLGWNAANPSETPAPPGGGNKYFDLRLLAAGQHIKVDGLQAATSVPRAIEILETLPVPKDGELPAVGFDAGNNWMFGTDFGILKVESARQSDNTLVVLASDAGGAKYTFTLQIVFTDPTLYALRIALDKDAPAAKIFAGLDFQIMYRKLSDGLGVFSAEIVLPTIMRRIDVGAVTITLPTFGVEIYTNGDFKFDIGFPYNEDFSRSFSVEAIIPPGIPVLGSGGFYFGKLPAVAVSQLPKATNGIFNPNIVFGFGAQMGVGKSIDYGILKAGFSITVFGIIEGILAKWNPYDKVSTGGGGALALDGEYFFWLRGTFGVLGHVYGSVDFVVIKASVDIRLKVYVQITLASYEPIPVTVSAEVTASASLTINLGLFKIHLSFSFALKISETFEIGYLQNPANRPWNAPVPTDGGRLLAPFAERLNMRSHNLVDARGQRLLATVQPVWARLKPQAPGQQVPLTAYAGFGLTVAGDRAFVPGKAPDLAAQFPAYIASLFVQGPGMAQEGDDTNMLRAAGEVADTSFELLAKVVARWAIASVQPGEVSAEEVDAIAVDDAVLAQLIEALNNPANPMPITSADVDAFMAGQFAMTASLPTTEATAEAAYFPMPMNLTLKAPAIGTVPALDYSFGGYNEVAPDFIIWLRDYFDQLAVQVRQEEQQVEEAQVLLADPISVANFIQGDYFVLLMKQMLQAMREGLRDFKQPLAAETVPNVLVAWVNTTGGLEALGKPFTLNDLFTGNQNVALTAGKTLKLPFVKKVLAEGDSFASLAEGQGYDATALATQNAAMAGILRAGVPIAWQGSTVVTSGNETLNVLAGRLGTTLPDMLAGTDVLARTDLLVPLAALELPLHDYATQPGDTLGGVAAAHGLTVQDLAGVARTTTSGDGTVPNPAGTSNGDQAGLFDADASKTLDLVYLPQFPVAELIAEAQRSGTLSHLSGMASRYYLHGLRLPTEKITPLQPGMWVTGTGSDMRLPADAGLFALTGQQIGVEVLPTAPLSLVLEGGSAVGWLTLDGPGGALSFDITPPTDALPVGDANYQRLKAVHDYASATVLPAGPRSITAMAEAGEEPARYPLSSSILWQSLAEVPFPTGTTTGAPVPRVWPLPSSMVALSAFADDPATLLTQPSPAFVLQKVTTDQTTGLPVDADMQVYGWASYVRFVVKKLPPGASAAQNDTCEITGASAEDTVILERIVQYVTQDAAFASLALGYQTASDSTGEVLRAEVGPDVTFGISQSNLSTVTRPPGGLAATALAEPLPATLLNRPTDLIRLLWEASITRNGGFFLYYFDKASGAGLPDSAFNDKGEAELNLVVMYRPDIRLQPWMNAVATGDAIDTSATNVVAKAVSTLQSHVVAPGNSLASVVARYNSTLVSLLRNTPEIALRDTPTSGAALNLRNAVYRVPYGGAAPGGALAAIAAHFAMAPDAIKAANPRIPAAAWDSDLPEGTAIRLPDVTRSVGTDPGGTSLQSIAAYYGSTLEALAGANAAEPALLADGQSLSLMTGPLAQHGSQAAGVQPVKALRDGLPQIPDDPKAAGYAQNYLLNDFTLLAWRVTENVDFIASNLGLPLSQQGETTQRTDDKVRYARALTAEDDLRFATSVPYVDLAKGTPAGDNPYAANGRLLQLDFGWNDVFGNRMVAEVDQAGTPAGRINGAPSLTGYTDLVQGVGQWPSISAHWTVADGLQADLFDLTIVLSFDPQPYLPDANDKTESWRSRARAGLQTVTTILAQLTDPAGMRLEVDTTLQPAPLTVPAAMVLPVTDATTLTAWLAVLQAFFQTQIGDQPADGFDGKDRFDLTVAAPRAGVPEAQIFELATSLILTRTGGVAEGDFAAIPAVRGARTRIAPLADVGSAADGNPGDGNVLKTFAAALQKTLSVPGRNSLGVATGTDRHAPAAGRGQSAVWVVRLGQDGSDSGIGFDVPPGQEPQIFAPEPVSNMLITRTVDIYPYADLTDYDPATDSFVTTPAPISFSGVDADTWVREFFACFDTLLSPEYSSSILVVDARAGNKPAGVTSFLTSLAEQKEALAGAASTLMAEVYQDKPGTHLASAREALRQSLLDKLSNLYSTRAAIAFGAHVHARIPQGPQDLTPQLYGNVQWRSDPQKLASLVTLTSPKLDLKDAADAPITFLLQAPQTIKVNGTVVEEIELDLRYAGAAIEHQIAPVPGVKGNYVASSWLSPVDKDFLPLSDDLGSFTVPILLRGFPATPRMERQSGTATNKTPDNLLDLTQWTYGFAYGLDFHYPQERVYGTVLYNIADNAAMALTAMSDAFPALAQFITSQTALVAQIGAHVPQIDAATSDQKQIDDAALALGAFLKMADDIAAQAAGKAPKTLTGAAGEVHGSLRMASDMRGLQGAGRYGFYIEEASQTFDDKGTPATAWVVTLTSEAGAPPPELTGDPVVEIEGAAAIALPSLGDPALGIYAYGYQEASGAWLQGANLQSVAERKVVLPGLQILDQQDAIASVCLTRNEDVGGPINPPFVYQTPEVSFPNPLHPSIATAQVVDIATLDTLTGKPEARPLEAQLNALFAALFEGGFAGEVTLQMDVIYDYAFAEGLQGLSVSIPVAVLPPMTVAVPGKPGDVPPPISDLVDQVSGAITAWSTAYKPSAQNGILGFRLTVMSNLTEQPMPLLRLLNLDLKVADIVPPMPGLF